jgi:MinD superfamily P-loop ATPase
VRGGRVVVVKGGKGGEGRSRFVVVVVVIVEPCFIKLRGGERGGDI